MREGSDYRSPRLGAADNRQSECRYGVPSRHIEVCDNIILTGGDISAHDASAQAPGERIRRVVALRNAHGVLRALVVPVEKSNIVWHVNSRL